MSLDLERQLTFYGAYHHDRTNVAIHICCVPLILFSGFVLATNSGTLIPLPDWLTVPYLDLNLGTLASLTWGGLYVLLEPVAGSLLAILCVTGTGCLNYMRVQNPSLVNQYAVGIQIGAWLLQFLGHGLFEGRAPALLDNLFQAVFLAPLFVWLEILFAFGYRQELQARVDKRVKDELAKLEAKKVKDSISNDSRNGKSH